MAVGLANATQTWQKPGKEMTDDHFKQTVSNLISSGKAYAQNTRTEREREVTLRYYFGEPYGDEEVDRSSFVTQEIMETTTWLLPALKKKFLWSNRPVEFTGSHDVDNVGGDPIRDVIAGKISDEQAQDASNYVAHVFYRENEGFKVLSDVFWDALVSKTGIMMHSWQEWKEQTAHRFFNLDQADLDAILAEEMPEGVSVEYEIDNEREVTDADGEVVQGLDGEPVTVIDITLTRTQDKAGLVFESVPPEDFFVTSSDIYVHDGMQGCFHRIKKARYEWLNDGYDYRTVMELPADTVETEELQITRQGRSTTAVSNVDPMQQECTGWQCFVHIDKDGDGVTELYRCVLGGEGGDFLMTRDGESEIEMVNEINYTDFCAWRVPHAFYGECPADRVANLQLLSSTVTRSTLDYFYEVNTPTLMIGEGAERDDGLTLRDATNRAPGSYVRGADISQIRWDRPPDMSQLAAFLDQWIDKKKVARTGSMPLAPATDPNSLQPEAATTTLDRRTAHDELIDDIAGSFADSLRRVFSQSLKLISRYSSDPKTIRVGEKMKTIDPRMLPSDMGMRTNVGLGSGIAERSTAQLVALYQTQQASVQTFGFADDNPEQGFVTKNQFYNTMADLVKAMGFDEPHRYFSDPTGKQQLPIPPQLLAQLEAEAMEKATQNALIQLEKYKTDTEAKVDMAKIRSDFEKAMMQTQQKDVESRRETEQKDDDSQRDAQVKLYEVNTRESTKRQEIAADMASGGTVNVSS